MKEFFISLKTFIKKNVFSCLCLLLSFLVCITGSLSYAKYISSSPANGNTGVGSFSCSATIDGVSALSFTNTAFWGGTVEDDKIAMNALRSINFSVNNFEVANGVERVSEVKMKYNLTFSAPENFVKKLAIQLFNEQNTAILPQIVLMDLIHSADHGHQFQTATSDDYNSDYHHDLTFETKKSGNDYTATFDGAIHDEPVKVVVKLEEFEQETHQILHFRTWDTSSVTSEDYPTVDTEGGKLLPPLQVNFTRNIKFYRVIISMSNMVLPANEKTTKKYSVRLAPTDAIEDDHLAGYFVSEQDGNYIPVTSIYGANNEGESIQYDMQTVKEKTVDTYYVDERAFNDSNNEEYFKYNHFNEQVVVEHDENLVGNARHYIVGETDNFENTNDTSYLELGSFSHDDREYIDQKYVYLRRTGTVGNYQWQLIDENSVQNNDNSNSYYRLYVKYGEVITRTALKLTQGTLKSEFKAIDTFTVKEVTEDANQTHCNVILNVVSENLLRYSVTHNAIGTKTVTKILDIEEEGLVLQVKNGNNWASTSEHIHEPNLNIQPLVITENIVGSNYNDTIKIYENEYTDYIIKEIIRDVARVKVDVEAVQTTIINGEGKPEDVVYTQDNPLNLYENNIQKVYLSQCYSKNYPFYVNVIFEQAQ